ncbi:hypothetical protein DR62_07465 [Burkholderia thailandensis]|uniref:Uncharacterized protein n=1 Tax=Burkholderia thailandensis TaxID=57975 RepID=A0AAW9CQP5_BURTH|nr:hypothetical protein DR62_07465 [Burkholderia thailandensis]AOI54983.1 hypothetical protein WI24_24620 [Burkholderia thailandensis]MDW9235651.1 hypothetical protein [Burkholderia thailandensis]MDW9251388.1 hypothetical protein [Burkholderia thailandensis]PJO69881.1 hypothetical protein CWD92_24440 [Burkholderia thailandensis]
MGVYPRSRRPPVTPRVFAHRSGGDAAVNWRLAAFARSRRRRRSRGESRGVRGHLPGMEDAA